jgi:hypothetical protein
LFFSFTAGDFAFSIFSKLGSRQTAQEQQETAITKVRCRHGFDKRSAPCRAPLPRWSSQGNIVGSDAKGIGAAIAGHLPDKKCPSSGGSACHA